MQAECDFVLRPLKSLEHHLKPLYAHTLDLIGLESGVQILTLACCHRHNDHYAGGWLVRLLLARAGPGNSWQRYRLQAPRVFLKRALPNKNASRGARGVGGFLVQ
jgi:hypothetical protein